MLECIEIKVSIAYGRTEDHYIWKPKLKTDSIFESSLDTIYKEEVLDSLQ